MRHFFILFTYFRRLEGTATFLTIIVSSVLGDVCELTRLFTICCIRLVSLGIILKLIDLFEFDFLLFMSKNLKRLFIDSSSVYFAIFVVINFALWISEQAQFKNFGSMLATICFLFCSQLIPYENRARSVS